MRPSELADFDAPPLAEVVLGVQYSRDILGFSGAHAGLFWAKSLDSEFDNVKEMPRLIATSPDSAGEIHRMVVGHALPNRSQFIHRTGDWVIQIQPDRFIANWRRGRPESEYPRFEECRRRFREQLESFEAFCETYELQLPRKNQLEVTYINHIPKGALWKSLDDVGAVFPVVAHKTESSGYLPTPIGISYLAVFEIPDSGIRLQASIKTAVLSRSGEEVLVCELTAKGFPDSGEEEADAQDRWFEQARFCIVKAFEELSSKEALKHWRLKE